MKNLIFKLIFSRVGPAVTALISTLLGVIVTQFAAWNIALNADLQQHIATALTGLVWLTINQLVNAYAGKHAKALQEAIGEQADRWIGPSTVNTAEVLADKVYHAKRPTQILP